MDVDGVLTGGEIIILDSGEEVKIWSVKDRMGFALLKHSKAPIALAWLTARQSKQVATRGKDIGVHFVRQNCLDKWRALQAIARELKLEPAQIAYIGDDYVDARPMKQVGLAVCPPESPELLKQICHYQTRVSAGKGVAREVIEMVLKAQGFWKRALAPFVGAFLISASLFLSACSSALAPPDLAETPDQWVEKFRTTETQGGIPVWTLNSEIAQFFNRKNKITLENVKIEFMEEQKAKKGNPKKNLLLAKKNLVAAATLESPKGEVNMTNKDLLAWGGVQVESQDGTLLTTERLLYSAEKKKILTDSPIRIVRKDSIVIGEGLEATPDLSVVKIIRHEASIYPKSLSLNKKK